MPETLGDLALEVRSKNAGPFWTTLELFMREAAGYAAAADEDFLNEEVIARLYGTDAEQVRIFRIPELRVVKISFPRTVPQGGFQDRDSHSGQHHVPLAALVPPAPGTRGRRTAPAAPVPTALTRWDTPALSNALRRTEAGADGQEYTDGSIHRVAGESETLFGTAVTATMRAREPGDDAVPVAELHRAILAVEGPVVVVVQDLDEVPGAGAFLGEVNGALLSALGISGFVTNGRVRDEPDLRGMGYAVHASGLCVARAHMRLTAIGVPVRVAGLDVMPGEMLHGDAHGVLKIPAGVAADLPALAEEIRAEERGIVSWARSADFTPEGLLALKRVRH